MSKASRARARKHKKMKAQTNSAPVPPIRKQAALVMLKTGTGLGRPRQDGDRYPGGRLKPPKPNARVVADREALMGSSVDLAKADDPLDFALAKGWISERLHKAGRGFQQAFEQSRIGAPGLDRGGPVEIDLSLVVSRGSWSEMPDAEVAAVFDRVFSASPTGAREERERKALERWKAINAVLGPLERGELFLVCVQASWPFWMLNEAQGHPVSAKWAEKRAALMRGLEQVAAAFKALRPPKARTPKVPAPKQAVVAGIDLGPKRAEHFSYVDRDGEPLYEVVRMKRAGRRGRA